MEQAENKPPSKVALYRETRKRHPDRNYKTSCDLNEDAIMEKVDSCTLNGRVAKRVEKSSESGTIIPEAFLQPYKAQIMKDTVIELMNMLQQVLPAEMITRITPSFKNPLSSLVDDENQDKSDKDGDDHDEANIDGGRERDDQGIENEIPDFFD